MMFYRLYVHRDSLTLFISILARPSIKFLILFLLDKLNNFGLSSFYVNWFQSYLSNRGKFSSSFSVLSGVPQGSTLGPPLFNIFINDLSAKINHSKCLLFADDLKIYRNIKSAEVCKALQVDIDAVQ
jgi:hypothetical protein